MQLLTHEHNHSLQNTEEEHITSGTTAAAPAAHRRYLSSPAAATLHAKCTVSCSGFLPQHKPHATCMQPLQCVLQRHVTNLHLSTRMATPDSTIMQPFHCDLQPQVQETHIELSTYRHNSWLQNTEEEPITSGTTAAASAARGTLHRRLQPLYRQSARFCAPASSPTQAPCNMHAAITMRFASFCSIM